MNNLNNLLKKVFFATASRKRLGKWLVEATIENNTQGALDLLAKGATLDEKNCGWTPLVWAAQHKNIELVEAFIAKGAVMPDLDTSDPVNREYIPEITQFITPAFEVQQRVAEASARKEKEELLVRAIADINGGLKRDICLPPPLMLRKPGGI